MKTSLRRIILVLAAVIGLGTVAIPASASGGSVLDNTWGGYTVNFVNPDPQNYPLAVSATWKVPAVANCSAVALTGAVATWVGLGGIGLNDLEQIGTDIQCNGPLGAPSYYAVYELLQPSQGYGSVQDLSQSKYPVSPGDSMRADVVEQGAGTGGSQFVLQEWDTGSSAHPKNWYVPEYWLGPGTSDPNVTPQTADWITEDPVLKNGYQDTFMKFSPAEVFKSCYWNQDNVKHPLIQGSGLTEYTITTLATRGSIGKEVTGPVATNGTQFQMTWKHN